MAHGQILVVDDDEEARTAVVEALEHAQFLVRTATNGRDALEALRTGPRPNLILLDLHMPVMDGWEFARRASADPAVADIPICMLSGVERSAGIPPQVVAVLRKPLDLSRLMSIVYQYC